MKHYQFNYTKKFSCIADKCKHNCCIGWEIKIDKKSLTAYKNLFVTDKRFNHNAIKGNAFNLVNRRCPFLDDDNLCHIIKNYTDKALCTTCKTHPRFKNFFNGITETGLGLYCEHACKIILTEKAKMRTVLVKDDKQQKCLSSLDKNILAFRKKAISFAQNRNLSISERLNALTSLANINLNRNSYREWIKVYSSLEKLEVNEYSFENLNTQNEFLPLVTGFDLEYENLLSYLCFRHLSRAIDNLDLIIRLAFVILSFKIINQIFALTKGKDLSSLIEACRFYSSEIETSDNNIFTLLDHVEYLVSYL